VCVGVPVDGAVGVTLGVNVGVGGTG